MRLWCRAINGDSVIDRGFRGKRFLYRDGERFCRQSNLHLFIVFIGAEILRHWTTSQNSIIGLEVASDQSTVCAE